MTNETINLIEVHYRPSWIDRLARTIERSKFYWLVCLGLVFLEGLLVHLAAWFDGSITPFYVERFQFSGPLWAWGTVLIIIHLKRMSLEALDDFRELLDCEDAEFEQLQYTFTTMPARPVFFFSFIWAGLFLLVWIIAPFEMLDRLEPLTYWTMLIINLFNFALGAGFYYFTVQLLRQINRAYVMSKPFNLFNTAPIFVFSRLTSQISIAFLILITFNFILTPLDDIDASLFALSVIGIPVALLAFVLPLWGAHKRLRIAKQKLQTEASQRLEAFLQSVHKAVDSNTLEDVANHNHVLTALGKEQEIINKLPVWPWSLGTLGSVASALLLPTLLLVIQIGIKRLLGG